MVDAPKLSMAEPAHNAPVCEKCGYSLAGLGEIGTEAVCPECGRTQTIRAKPRPPSIGWGAMLGGIAAPWLLLPFALCAWPFGLVAPLLLSLLVALGCSERFAPVQDSTSPKQVGVAAGLWAVVSIVIVCGGSLILFALHLIP